MRRLPRAAFFLLALPAVGRAAWRCASLERRLPLDQLVSRMRAVPPFRVAALARPEWLLATLDRVLTLLPPWRYGRCLKRSLLLLDLWARSGLRPRLHLGVRREGEGRHQAHAWVTVEGATDDEGRRPAVDVEQALVAAVDRRSPATSSQGYPEAFVF